MPRRPAGNAALCTFLKTSRKKTRSKTKAMPGKAKKKTPGKKLTRTMKRRPEPELMDSEAQTLAYAEADFDEANSLFVDNFRNRFNELPGNGRMADLGCGPGDIAIRMATIYPGWNISGLDAA